MQKLSTVFFPQKPEERALDPISGWVWIRKPPFLYAGRETHKNHSDFKYCLTQMSSTTRIFSGHHFWDGFLVDFYIEQQNKSMYQAEHPVPIVYDLSRSVLECCRCWLEHVVSKPTLHLLILQIHRNSLIEKLYLISSVHFLEYRFPGEFEIGSHLSDRGNNKYTYT